VNKDLLTVGNLKLQKNAVKMIPIDDRIFACRSLYAKSLWLKPHPRIHWQIGGGVERDRAKCLLHDHSPALSGDIRLDYAFKLRILTSAPKINTFGTAIFAQKPRVFDGFT